MVTKRVLLLAAMGLGALYLIHILASDYQKIRGPAAKLARFLLSKRDLGAVLDPNPPHPPKIDKFVIDWNKIMNNDPLHCALSLICQIAAGAERLNEEAIIIDTLIRYGIDNDAPRLIKKAHEFGLQANSNPEKCYLKYPKCPWSAKSMLRILHIHSFIFGS